MFDSGRSHTQISFLDWMTKEHCHQRYHTWKMDETARIDWYGNNSTVCTDWKGQATKKYPSRTVCRADL
jgi:hypothetical protein